MKGETKRNEAAKLLAVVMVMAVALVGAVCIFDGTDASAGGEASSVTTESSTELFSVSVNGGDAKTYNTISDMVDAVNNQKKVGDKGTTVTVTVLKDFTVENLSAVTNAEAAIWFTNTNVSITFDGNGKTIEADETAKYQENKNILGFDNGTTGAVHNLTIDGNKVAHHGINIFVATVDISNCVVKDNHASGVTVNGSIVTATNLKMSGNGWGDINVDCSDDAERSGATIAKTKLTIDSIQNLSKVWSELYNANVVSITDGTYYGFNVTETKEGKDCTYSMFLKDETNAVSVISAAKSVDFTKDITLTKKLENKDSDVSFSIEKDVTLTLNVTGTKDDRAAIAGKSVTITGEGTLNVTFDGSEYAKANENTTPTSGMDNDAIYGQNYVTIRGVNAVIQNTSENYGYKAIGIESKKITIENSESFIVTADNRAIYSQADGIKITNSEVTATGGEFGIRSTGNISIDGSIVTATAQNSQMDNKLDDFGEFGIISTYSSNNVTTITITGSDVTTTGIACAKKVPGNVGKLTDLSNISISGKTTITVKSGSAIFGKVQNGDETTNSVEFNKIRVGSADVVLSVGSVNIRGDTSNWTEDEETGTITITGDVKISGTADVNIIVKAGANVTVPADETLTLNKEMTVESGSSNITEINVLGNVDGTGKIKAAASASTDKIKITSTNPDVTKNMVDGMTVASAEIVDYIATSTTIDKFQELASENTALVLTGNYTIEAGEVLTLPSTVTLYLNGHTLTIANKTSTLKAGELVLNGTKVVMGAPDSSLVTVNDPAAAKISVDGNLSLDAADVCAPVSVNETSGYVSISNPKTMEVKGSLTTSISAGYGNTVVLSGLTVPAGMTVSVFGTMQVQDSITVSTGANFIVYAGGFAQIDGTVTVNGVFTAMGKVEINGTVNVTNDNGGAVFKVADGANVTVAKDASFTVSKVRQSGITAVNSLEIAGDDSFTVEGTLTVTGTLSGTVNDKGTVVFNGVAGSNAKIRLFDGVSVTITSVTGTITVFDDEKIVDGPKGNHNIMASNSVVLSNVKGVTVSEELRTASKDIGGEKWKFYYTVMTVSGNVNAVNETGEYGTVTVSNAKEYSVTGGKTSKGTENVMTVGDLNLGKNVKLVLDGSVVKVTGTVNAVAKNSNITTNKRVTVEGVIVVGPEAGKTTGSTIDQGVLSINGATYTVQDAEGKDTVYYTTLANAISAYESAYEKKITLCGSVAVSSEMTVPAGAEIVFENGAKLTISTKGVVTVSAEALLDGTNGTISVDGKLIINDRNTGLKFNTSAGKFVYQVYTENGDVATYTGILGALEDAAAGDVITLKQSAYITSSFTIKDGVTLVIPKGVTLSIGSTTDDLKVTVNGTLEIQNGGSVAKVGSSEKKVEIIVNGVVSGVDGLADGFDVDNYVSFTAKVNGKDVEFYSNIAFAAQTAVEGNVTVVGDVSGGDVVFTKGEKADSLTITVSEEATLSVSSLTLVDAELDLDGEFTGAVKGASAQIDLKKVSRIEIVVSTEETTEGDVKKIVISGELVGKATVSSGTVLVGTSLVVGGEDNLLTVAAGATLQVDKTRTLLSAGYMVVDDDYYVTAFASGVIIDGTLVINERGKVYAGIMTVNGTVAVNDSGEFHVYRLLFVNGTITVSATEGKEGVFEGEGSIIIGTAPTTLGASASIVGEVTVSEIVAYPGADLSQAKINMVAGESQANDLEVYINGSLYMTLIANNIGGEVSSINNILTLLGIDIDGYDIPTDESGKVDIAWYVDADCKKAVTALDDLDKVYAELVASSVKGTITEGTGIDLFIDGVKYSYGMDSLKVGTHTVTYGIQTGYDGSKVAVTFNGATVTDGKIVITADMKEFTLSVTGAVPSSSSVVVDNGKDGSLTDILLIVLVVLIAVMAIMVALRMMRS